MDENEKKGKKVLLAEDDVFVSDVYSMRLRKEGYDVTLAKDGREALDQLNRDIPDILLLDIMMPYMDGMEVLEIVKKKEEFKNIPVIMLTNLSEKENIQKTIEMGASDYLIKSHFTPSEVVEKVNITLFQE
ncbi:MAG: response regulator [Candidatus Moraniibacteriota bacterium]|nr:MAG: response regulator [Candidatus Moranbacteria bacterium]